MKSRKSLRHRLLAATTIVAAATLLAGCASNAPSTPTGAGAAGTVKGSTITIGTISQLKTQFQTYANAYMKAYPGRKVVIRGLTSDVTQYTQLLATERLSKSLPDIFFNVDFLANTFADDNVALDLAPGLAAKKDGLNLSSFLPQFVGQYRPEKHPTQITGLPVSADSTALVYNKTLFKQAGVTDLPNSSWTWDDFYRVAAEIEQKSGGKITGAAAPLTDGTNSIVFGPVLKAYRATLYDPKTNTSGIGSAAADKAWTSLIKFYGSASGAYTTSATDPSLLFESGNVAMAIASRGSIPTYRSALTKDQWDVTEIPSINGVHPSGGGSYGLSIAQSSKNEDAAWAFLAWFYNTSKGMKVAQTPAGGGIIPPTTAGLQGGAWADVSIPSNIKVFATTAKQALLMQQLPGSAQPVLGTAVQKAVQEVVLQHVSVQQAFDEAQATVDAALKTAK
jgi:multiple sugar transport system substrate-binding protein